MIDMLFEFMTMILFIALASMLACIALYFVFIAISLILDTICEIIGFIKRKGRK